MAATIARILSKLRFPVPEALGGTGYTSLSSMVSSLLLQKKPFVTTPQTVVAGDTMTITHGLGVTPSNVSFTLTCLTAEAGYAIGDTIAGVGYYSTINAANNRGASFYWSDTTTVNGKFGTSPQVFAVPHKTTGALTGLTNANWSITVRVYP